MDDQILLSISFTISDIECFSKALVYTDQSYDLIQYLEENATFTFTPTANNIIGKTYTNQELLDSIKVVSDPTIIAAFKTLYDNSFYVGCPVIEELLDKIDDSNK